MFPNLLFGGTCSKSKSLQPKINLLGFSSTSFATFITSSTLCCPSESAVTTPLYSAKLGKVRESQPENTAMGTIYFDQSIGEMVKHFTAKELSMTGIKVGIGKLTILGNVKKLKIDDLGYSVDFSYTINYKLLKNGEIVWDKDYSPTIVTVSKFESSPREMITSQTYRLIASGYEKFINDNGVKTLLENNR